jgi:hypothetical protein
MKLNNKAFVKIIALKILWVVSVILLILKIVKNFKI